MKVKIVYIRFRLHMTSTGRVKIAGHDVKGIPNALKAAWSARNCTNNKYKEIACISASVIDHCPGVCNTLRINYLQCRQGRHSADSGLLAKCKETFKKDVSIP